MPRSAPCCAISIVNESRREIVSWLIGVIHSQGGRDLLSRVDNIASADAKVHTYDRRRPSIS